MKRADVHTPQDRQRAAINWLCAQEPVTLISHFSTELDAWHVNVAGVEHWVSQATFGRAKRERMERVGK